MPSATLHRSGNVPQPIPDLGTTTSTLVVPASATIGDVNVTLNLSHPRGEDLDVFLIAPDQTRIELLTGVAFPRIGNEAPFRPLTLSDEADVSVQDARTQFVGRFFPEGSLLELSGLEPAGTWTLEVSDTRAGGTGFIADWSMTITDLVTETEPNATKSPHAIETSTVVTGAIHPPGDEDSYRFTLTSSGSFIVEVSAMAGSLLRPRLTLFGPDQQEIVRSDGTASEVTLARIAQQLDAGTYVVRLSASLTSGPEVVGEYRLLTEFSPTARRVIPPANRVGVSPYSVAVGDVNGDGRFDLITANFDSNDVSVLLGNGDGSFQTQHRFPAGAGPISVRAEDVNGDDHLDLVIANFSSDDATVLLGNGNGSFETQRNFSVGTYPFEVAVRDVNGDGLPDLVTANYGSDDVSVLLGNGDGSFQNQRRFSVGTDPQSVAVADVNGDGRLDLIAANYGSNNVSVLLGTGDGFFQNQRRFPVGSLPYSVAAGDVNGDGRVDLVTANYGSDDASVLLGNGDGFFQTQRRFSVGTDPQSIALSDVNGDSLPDLITANAGSDDVTVLLGNGAGTFAIKRVFSVGDYPTSVVVQDVNGDGRPDLVTANALSNDVSILLGNIDGTFSVDQRSLDVGASPNGVAVGDVNGDGHPDLITVNRLSDDVSVLLSNGTGSFQTESRFPLGDFPYALTVADINGDGRPDLVTGNRYSGDVSILLGKGDGSFQDQRRIDVGAFPESVAVGDVNGDGRPDLVTANYGSNDASVLLGNGDGSFQGRRSFAVGASPQSVVLREVNGDGHLDLITANRNGDNLSLLLGNGDGSFQNQRLFAVGHAPGAAEVSDVNGDGRPDLIAANSGKANDPVNGDNPGTTVSILLGNGDGFFQNQRVFSVGVLPYSVAVADVNGDGRPDLIAANLRSDDVSVLLGNGDGSFQDQRLFTVGASPASLVVQDVNGDTRLDLVTANKDSNNLTVLAGNGDGTFQDQARFDADTSPVAVTVADLNGDGKADLISSNVSSNDVKVLLGKGDGTFQEQQGFSVGDSPFSEAVGDVNGDGRPDLVTANYRGNDISVLLGNGDGSFQSQSRFSVGIAPYGVAIADVNGDDRLDLMTANFRSDNVSLLLGNGDGSFQPQRVFAAGNGPVSVAVTDVNGDGALDLIAANYGDDTVSVLLGKGNGLFQNPRGFPVGLDPISLAVGDLNGDGYPDLVTANRSSADVSVLLGKGDGSFQRQRRFDVGRDPISVVVADLNGDDRPDLSVANFGNYDVSVLLGIKGGSFQTQRVFAVSSYPRAVAAGDVNGDGRPDLITANRNTAELSVLLGNGDATFVTASPDRSSDLRHTPHRGDVNRDGTPDVVVLNDSGEILFRRGIPDTDNLFAPPVVLNPRRPARDLALFHTGGGLAIAASDVEGDTVSVYGFSGGFHRTTAFKGGLLPQRISAADLNGDRRDDLIVVNTLDNTVSIAFQQRNGSFPRLLSREVGVTPTDIAIADVDAQDGPDILIANRSSGDVSVLYNDPGHSFVHSARYRAGLGLYDLQVVNERIQPLSLELPVSLVAAPFTSGDGKLDLVVFDRGSRQLRSFLGTGSGFTDPDEALSIRLTNHPSQPAAIPGQSVAGFFDGDRIRDVAVLMVDRDEVWIYKGNGDGTFALLSTSPAGNSPDGLSLSDIDSDGKFDLLVGNGFGDILFLRGQGDGTFASFVRADNRVPFVTTDLDGDLVPDVVLAQQANDLVRSLSRDQLNDSFTPGAFERDADNGLIGPGDVALADLDGVNGDDLIFANTGSNNVLVYLRQPDGSYAEEPLSFFAGTSPRGLHVAQLNDDNDDSEINSLDFPDLAIANQGSNDVSVLLGSRGVDVNQDGAIDGHDLFRLGPRLEVGRAGPTFVTSAFLDGEDDVIPDLIAASTQGSRASLLPGVGSGLFNDRNRTTINLGSPPIGLDLNFALLANGNIVSLNFTGATTLFTATERQGVAFAVVPLPGLDFPVFFTANSDGSVSALATANGVNYTEIVNLPEEGLGSPSALAVLQGTNAIEVYVSDARDNGLVVLRFDYDDFAISTLTSLGQSGGESLVLVATLSNSLLVENGPPTIDGLEPAVVFGLEVPASDLVAVEGVLVSAGQEILSLLEEARAELEEEEPPLVSAEPLTLQDFLAGLEEALRDLGWKRLKRVPAPAPDVEDELDPEKWQRQELESETQFLPFFLEENAPNTLPNSASEPARQAAAEFLFSTASLGDASLSAIEAPRKPITPFAEQRSIEPLARLAPWLSSAVFATWLHRRHLASSPVLYAKRVRRP